MTPIYANVCVHVRLINSLYESVECVVKWVCLKKLVMLNGLPHSGDAIAVYGLENPTLVDWTIFTEVCPGDKVSWAAVKLRPLDIVSENDQ